MSITITVNDLCELTKANEESKELWRKEYKKIKELFKLVRECEKGYRSFRFKSNAEISKTYDKAKGLYEKTIRVNKKLEEVYEETKELEQKHIDLHEKAKENEKITHKKLFNKESRVKTYRFTRKKEALKEALLVFNNSVSEIRYSYGKVLNKIGDKLIENHEDEMFDIFQEVLKKEREITKKIMDRTNKEVKKILDEYRIKSKGDLRLNEMVCIKEALLVFNGSAFEMECSYGKVFGKVFNDIDTILKDNYEYGCEGSVPESDRRFMRGTFYAVFKKERERTKEVVDRTNKEVKKILDELAEENIRISGGMIQLHGRLLEETKKELSFQFMSLKMLRYIRRRMEEIDAFKGEIKEALRKEYKAFKAYEKVYNEGFNEMEEEVAFETFKRAFEDIKELCERLYHEAMSNVAPLFQAFEEFCRVRESCVKKLSSNLIEKIKRIVTCNLLFEVKMVKVKDKCCFSDDDKFFYERNDFYSGNSDNADVLYAKAVSMMNSYDGKCIQWCAPSKKTDDYLRRELQTFPITVDLISELIRKIKRIVMDNLYCEYVGENEGEYIEYRLYCPDFRPVESYNYKFPEDIDSKLLEVLQETPDKSVQNEVKKINKANKAKVMLCEEWKKWAKVHNTFFDKGV